MVFASWNNFVWHSCRQWNYLCVLANENLQWLEMFQNTKNWLCNIAFFSVMWIICSIYALFQSLHEKKFWSVKNWNTYLTALTSFLAKRPPKSERERFLGFSGPKKFSGPRKSVGLRKEDGSGLREARNADPLLWYQSPVDLFFSTYSFTFPASNFDK